MTYHHTLYHSDTIQNKSYEHFCSQECPNTSCARQNSCCGAFVSLYDRCQTLIKFKIFTPCNQSIKCPLSIVHPWPNRKQVKGAWSFPLPKQNEIFITQWWSWAPTLPSLLTNAPYIMLHFLPLPILTATFWFAARFSFMRICSSLPLLHTWWVGERSLYHSLNLLQVPTVRIFSTPS